METVAQPGGTLRDGRYEILELLRAAPGKDVYLARDRVLDCAVVVDVSRGELTPFQSSTVAREARILGRLGDHPNIGSVIDSWHDKDSSYMVSRHLPGGSLQAVVEAATSQKAPLPVEQILGFALQLAHALEHIHERGIIHRDLQPRNVLRDTWGTLRLVDFDTAISLDDRVVESIFDGMSIEHMAPEVVAGGLTDGRADLYSLGTTMYTLCEGHPPHTGTNEEIGRARSLGRPDIERRDLPEGLHRLISELLAPHRQDRPASAVEVVRRLQDLVNSEKGLDGLIDSEESATLEFKSSLRTPVGQPPADVKRTVKELQKAVELSALKTIAAFLNTKGGTLVVGVADDKTIVGIEADYTGRIVSSDGWKRMLDELISARFGTDALRSIDVRLAPYRGKTVAIVECRPRDQPTWLDDDLFVRRTASTVNLNTKQAWAWFQRWKRST